MVDQQKLARAYDALDGLQGLECVAEVLRSGNHTPDFLNAVAKRLDPQWGGANDRFRLMLVKRKTARFEKPIDKGRRERMERVLDVQDRMLDARLKGRDIESVAAELAARHGRSRAWVFATADLDGPDKV